MRCKNCGSTFEKRYPNQIGKFRFCLDTDECTSAFWDAVKEDRIKKAKREKIKKRKELETVQDLLKKAQAVFNQYIRLRDKDKKCISCDSKLKGKFDAGHYVSSGSCKALTFTENNVHGQCVHCNQHKHGNLISYREGLINRLGIDTVEELEKMRHKTAKYTREELRELIIEYKQKIKDRS